MRRKESRRKRFMTPFTLLSAMVLLQTSLPMVNPSLIDGNGLVSAQTDGDYSTGVVINYTVKAGDYLYKIANEYGVTVDELRLWNHLTSDILRVGQTLKIIPFTVARPPAGTIHTVQAGETLWRIAYTYKVTVAQLKQWNNLTSDIIPIGMRLKVTGDATTPPPETGSTYTVRSGDTLWGIGQRFGVTVAQLKSWNNLTSDFLRIGQVLKLTGSTTTPPPETGTTYTVRSGDTLWGIGQRFGVTVAQLKSWNNLTSDFLRIGQVLKLTGSTTTPPPETGTTYTVKAGDTLYAIAQRHGVTVAQLKSWNNLTTDFLRIGQVLKLTGSTTTPPPVTGATYTVKAGDTLYGIAQRHGVTVAQLKSWNSLTSDFLRIGQVLKVTGTTTPAPDPTPDPTPDPSPDTPFSYTVKAGDTLYSIANRYGTTVALLKSWNGLASDSLSIGQVLRINESSLPTPVPGTVYTVQAGDTLWNIAYRYDITVDQLRTWNSLTSDSLSIGQMLRVSAP